MVDHEDAVTLLLVVPDGVGVRNFVHGRFLGVWRQQHREVVHVCTGIPAASLRDVAAHTLGATQLHEMPIYRERPGAGLWRKALEVAHLTRFKTTGMRQLLSAGTPKGLSRRALLNRAAYAVGSRASSDGRRRALVTRYVRSVRRTPTARHYRDLLTRMRPSVVFVTHQRPPQMFPLVIAARDLGIPTACFIFSWDNLSSKGRAPVSFDYYFVWSDHMRSELLQFYPDVRPERVIVVGSPQFEPYAYDDFGWTEEQFCRETGASPGCRRLCFSAGDTGTSPNDPAYVEALARANRLGAFGESVELLVRPSPAEDQTRFARVAAEYPEVIWVPPRWRQTRTEHPEPWSQRVPQASDLHLLKSLTRYSAVNINMASTMTLDFAYADKAIVNVGFGGSRDYPDWPPDLFFYDYDHYRPAIESGASRLARNPAELIAAVQGYLADPALDREGRQALLDRQVGVSLRGTSERISQALARIAGRAVSA